MKQIDNSMNIKPPKNDVNTSIQPGRGRVDSSAPAPASTSSAPVSNDSITLTETASAISQFQQYLASLPDVDSNRVSEIKTALSEGSYQIDAQKIADNLLKA